jgi:hypothetical protein
MSRCKSLHEKAANVEEFSRRLAEQAADGGQRTLNAYKNLAPAESRSLPGLQVYYIHQFGVNGVFLGSGMCLVKETAKLRPVEGGIDKRLPRVSAHELGHAMGLPHRQNVMNLMASGTAGTMLNEAEVEIARHNARKVAGALTVDECEAKANEADAHHQPDQAAAMRRDLGQLPK